MRTKSNNSVEVAKLADGRLVHISVLPEYYSKGDRNMWLKGLAAGAHTPDSFSLDESDKMALIAAWEKKPAFLQAVSDLRAAGNLLGSNGGFNANEADFKTWHDAEKQFRVALGQAKVDFGSYHATGQDESQCGPEGVSNTGVAAHSPSNRRAV